MPFLMTSLELAQALRELFTGRNGEFDVEAFVAAARVLDFDARPLHPPMATPKPLADNYLADLLGVNLAHALEAYDWKDWRPVTEDGVTISAFWRSSGAPDRPAAYELDAGGRYLRPVAGQLTGHSLPAPNI
jgi:hypothetical protein